MLFGEERNFSDRWKKGMLNLTSAVPTSVSDNYLWTYDLSGPIHNAFDAGKSIMKASGRGVGPLEIKTFWALWNGIEPLGECHLGLKKVKISRAQPPSDLSKNGIARIKSITYRAVSMRSIGSFMYMSFQGP
jgi:hypothetical protein